jgi:hypothetical protein
MAVGVRVAVRVEVGVRVIVTLPDGTGKVAVRVLVGTRVSVFVGLGVEVEVGVAVADAVIVGVAVPKIRGEARRLMVPHPSTMTTKPIVRAITRLLQETAFRYRLGRLRGARKYAGRGAPGLPKNTGHSWYFPPRQNSP